MFGDERSEPAAGAERVVQAPGDVGAPGRLRPVPRLPQVGVGVADALGERPEGEATLLPAATQLGAEVWVNDKRTGAVTRRGRGRRVAISDSTSASSGSCWNTLMPHSAAEWGISEPVREGV